VSQFGSEPKGGLLDCGAAAKYLGISKSTLDKWRVTGRSPVHYKIGRRVLFRASDLDVWLESRKRRSTSEIVEG
jgi:excisionase family DNA binding protein